MVNASFGPQTAPDLEAFPERFVAKITAEGGCWRWDGTKNAQGYGQIYEPAIKHMVYAHRFAYEFVHGPIPDGLQIDHLCRNPSCANPSHLEAVSSRENTLRGRAVTAINAAKTHCPRGASLRRGEHLHTSRRREVLQSL